MISIASGDPRERDGAVGRSSEGKVGPCRRRFAKSERDGPIESLDGSCWLPGCWAGSCAQGGSERAKQGFAATACVVHELEEAEIERQLLLRDAPVRACAGPPGHRAGSGRGWAACPFPACRGPARLPACDGVR